MLLLSAIVLPYSHTSTIQSYVYYTTITIPITIPVLYRHTRTYSYIFTIQPCIYHTIAPLPFIHTCIIQLYFYHTAIPVSTAIPLPYSYTSNIQLCFCHKTIPLSYSHIVPTAISLLCSHASTYSYTFTIQPYLYPPPYL